MSKSYITDEDFFGINFTEVELKVGDYENCVFKNCSFANQNLSNFSFEECIFEDCDLSNIKTENTAFQSIKFNNCKLIGVHFDQCNTFLLKFNFENCQLNLSSFYRLQIKETIFINCLLHEVDFTETFLIGCKFENCDFSGTVFESTVLEKADLRTSFNFSINPENNRIQGAKFSIDNVTGLLHQYNIEIE